MLIRLERFQGVAPRYEPHLLPDNAAVTAQNCKLMSGALRPWAAPLAVNTPSKVGTKLSIFKYGSFWLHWLADVDVVRGPLAADAYDRVYFSGDGSPKMTANDIATAGGGTDYPTNSYELGVPAPISAPSVAAAGTPDPNPPDPLHQEDRAYVYTYVSAYGEEGPPSQASNTVTWSPGQTVDVTSLGGAPTGPHNITLKKVYRTNTGSEGTSYQLVATIPVAVASHNDAIASDTLGIVLPSVEWDAPPTDLAGLCVHPGGFLVGFAGKELCLSEPYLPHAWPVSYRIPVDGVIAAVGIFGTSILVVTETGLPYVVTGAEPGSMSVEKLEKGQACVSKRGTVDMGHAVVYPAPDGLMAVGVGQASMVTEKILGRDEWRALNPGSIHAYLYAGRYVGFYDNGTQGGFIFTPTTGDLTFIDTYATAGFSDPATGKLYLQVGNDIVEWDGGSDLLDYTWKSKPFRAPVPANFGACQVFADSYPVTVKVYADGALKHTEAVADDSFFRLPSGFRAVDWQIEVSGAANVNSVLLASSAGELGRI